MNTREQLEKHIEQNVSPEARTENDQRLTVFEEAKKLTQLTAHLNNDPFFERVTRMAAVGDGVGVQTFIERPTPMLGIMPASDTWIPFPDSEFWPLALDDYRLSRSGSTFEPNGACDHCSEPLTASERKNPCALWMSAGTVIVEFHFCRKCGLYLSNRFELTREAWRDFNGSM